MLNTKKNLIITFLVILTLFTGCKKNGTIESLHKNDLFTLPYGNFEEQLSVAGINSVGSVKVGIAMRDGFFYIVDGASSKTMELNSYGDLLSLYYNEDSETADLIKKSIRPAASVHCEIGYPFEYPGLIAIDSSKCIYEACIIPKATQELRSDGVLLSQAVIRFARDGSNVDYIGQQGPGGTPFPMIKNIYITEKDELVVVCNLNEGYEVFWFGTDNLKKYSVVINPQTIPQLSKDETDEKFVSICNVIPDLNEDKLYISVDYYENSIDEDSKLQSGIDYIQTLLYTLDCKKETYDETVSVPPYEESVVVDYSKLNYKIPYEFMGATKNGWKYFILKTQDGFNIEMIQNESQKILRRHFVADHENNLFYNMYLSPDGIIAAIYMDKDIARVVWYRTDSLIDAILKN